MQFSIEIKLNKLINYNIRVSYYNFKGHELLYLNYI